MENLQSPAGFRLSTGTSDSEDPRNDRVITDGMGQGTLQFCSFPGTQIISHFWSNYDLGVPFFSIFCLVYGIHCHPPTPLLAASGFRDSPTPPVKAK